MKIKKTGGMPAWRSSALLSTRGGSDGPPSKVVFAGRPTTSFLCTGPGLSWELPLSPCLHLPLKFSVGSLHLCPCFLMKFSTLSLRDGPTCILEPSSAELLLQPAPGTSGELGPVWISRPPFLAALPVADTGDSSVCVCSLNISAASDPLSTVQAAQQISQCWPKR